MLASVRQQWPAHNTMSPFVVLFAVFAVLNGVRFYHRRKTRFLVLSVLFTVLAARNWVVIPLIWVMSALVIFLIVYALFRLKKRVLDVTPLLPLSAADETWRKSLSEDDQLKLIVSELSLERRLTKDEAVQRLTGKTTAENELEEAHAKELRDLEITPVTQPLKFIAPTGSCGWLRIDSVQDPQDEDGGYLAPVRCQTWVEDPALGSAPQVSYTSLHSVVSFPPAEAGLASQPRFWTEMEPDFQTMFKNRCLLAKVPMVDDGRERFDLEIGGRSFTIMTKYLYWEVDLSLDPDEQTLWVRFSKMHAEVWDEPKADSDGTPKFRGMEQLRAFCYPVPVSGLLPTCQPKAHANSVEELEDLGWEEEDEGLEEN